MIGRESCPFCERIERGDYDGAWLGGVHFEPLNPVTPGHRLFVARQHENPLHNPFDVMWRVRNERRAPWEPYYEPRGLGGVLPLLYMWRREQQITEEFNLILNVGEDASQSIEHLHLHYMPRRHGDGLTLPWTHQSSDRESDDG